MMEKPFCKTQIPRSAPGPNTSALPTLIFSVAVFFLLPAPRANATGIGPEVLLFTSPTVHTIASDILLVPSTLFEIIRLPMGVAEVVLAPLPGLTVDSGMRNIGRGLQAPFRTVGAIIQLPLRILGRIF